MPKPRTLSTEELDKFVYPTPFFVFDRQVIRRNYQRFKQLFPTAEIRYAIGIEWFASIVGNNIFVNS